jgi:hypothetical protein
MTLTIPADELEVPTTIIAEFPDGSRREHIMQVIDRLPGCDGKVARIDMDTGDVLFAPGLNMYQDEKPSHYERRLKRMNREFKAWKKARGVEDVNFNLTVH